MGRRLATTLLTCAFLGTLPAAAIAQECQGPPGTSAVDQYCESIPAAGGTSRPGSSSGQSGASGSSGASSVSGTVERQLAGSDDGQAVLGLAAASATPSEAQGGGSATSGNASNGSAETPASSQRPADSQNAANIPSTSALKAVSSSVQNGGTIGDAFIWALIGVTVIAAVAGWLSMRRRRRDPEPPTSARPSSLPS